LSTATDPAINKTNFLTGVEEKGTTWTLLSPKKIGITSSTTLSAASKEVKFVLASSISIATTPRTIVETLKSIWIQPGWALSLGSGREASSWMIKILFRGTELPVPFPGVIRSGSPGPGSFESKILRGLGIGLSVEKDTPKNSYWSIKSSFLFKPGRSKSIRTSVAPTGHNPGVAVTGGVVTGGLVVGWDVTGGVVTGGLVVGGDVTGGVVTGGVVVGWEVTGGVVVGWEVTGGVVTGGVVVGWEVTGGLVTGGLVTGGVVIGGLVRGGNVIGGDVTGTTVVGGAVVGGVVGVGKSTRQIQTSASANERVPVIVIEATPACCTSISTIELSCNCGATKISIGFMSPSNNSTVIWSPWSTSSKVTVVTQTGVTEKKIDIWPPSSSSFGGRLISSWTTSTFPLGILFVRFPPTPIPGPPKFSFGVPKSSSPGEGLEESKVTRGCCALLGPVDAKNATGRYWVETVVAGNIGPNGLESKSIVNLTNPNGHSGSGVGEVVVGGVVVGGVVVGWEVTGGVVVGGVVVGGVVVGWEVTGGVVTGGVVVGWEVTGGVVTGGVVVGGNVVGGLVTGGVVVGGVVVGWDVTGGLVTGGLVVGWDVTGGVVTGGLVVGGDVTGGVVTGGVVVGWEVTGGVVVGGVVVGGEVTGGDVTGGVVTGWSVPGAGVGSGVGSDVGGLSGIQMQRSTSANEELVTISTLSTRKVLKVITSILFSPKGSEAILASSFPPWSKVDTFTWFPKSMSRSVIVLK